MADDYKTITRVIEYHGSQEWLEKVMANSRIPIQGALNTGNGMYIKSGIIIWQPDAVTEQQVEDSNKQPQTVKFKRPGME